MRIRFLLVIILCVLPGSFALADGGDLDIPEPKRLGDLWYFVCNISKAKKKLGWQPKTSNETGLTNLIDWIKDNLTIFFGENR